MTGAREEVRRKAHGDARVDARYLVLAAAACAIATFGLLENSTAIIIGAMLIAPLMGPIISLALALVEGDAPLAARALLTLLTGGALSIAFSPSRRERWTASRRCASASPMRSAASRSPSR